MYEPSHKGAWFRWESLSGREKGLVAGSFAAVFVGFLLMFRLMDATRWAYELGYRAGSGGRMPPSSATQLSEALVAPITVAAVLCFAVGGVLWALFSRSQDELFNRVQGRAVGIGSAVTMALMGLWLAAANIVAMPALTAYGVVWLWLLACGLFWMVEARRHWR